MRDCFKRGLRTEMIIGNRFYCPKCKEIVTPTAGEFQHPHLGTRPCYICPKCQGMVYMKDDRKGPGVV